MKRVRSAILDFARGALMGVAEIIPGVSGGTIALIVGVYQRLVFSAANFVRLRWREVEWALILPLLFGMFAAIFAAAAVIEPLLDNYPSLLFAFFAGLIVASLRVPYNLATADWKPKNFILAGVATIVAAAFALAPGGAEQTNLQPWLISAAAALAVCALVLPGVSGSYLLLALGIYAPTVAAVNDRDLGYLAWFVLGAVLGLAAFVNLLRWLLRRHHEITFSILTGLLAGSLLALWPWGFESGAPVSPPDLPIFEALSFAAGLVLVLAISGLERRLRER